MVSFGGSSGSGQSSSSATQGFSDLPPEIQNAFKDLATQAQNLLPGNNPATTQMYTPLQQTAGETQAINSINQGFNPNPTTFANNVNMQMNPYDQNVIGQINKNAYGQNSMLSSTLSQAGQFGSNRAALGANDIASTQANTIGSLLNPEYNQAVQNTLTTIPQQQLADANAQLSAGQFQRSLAGQTNQAPVNALAAISQILGILPTNSGTSQSSGSNNSSGFNFGLNPFSDERLKENIIPVGMENGFPIYEFNYIGFPNKYIGVIAQDVEKIRPDAVVERDGFKTVDYDKIGVRFRDG